MERAQYDLARGLGVSAQEVRRLEDAIAGLAKQTDQFSRQELQRFVHGLKASETLLGLANRETTQFAEKLLSLGAGAGKTAKELESLMQRSAVLNVRFREGRADIAEYYEAYAVGGRRGLAAAVNFGRVTREALDDQVEKLREWDAATTRVRTSWENFSLGVADSLKNVVSPQVIATTQHFMRFAAQAALITTAVRPFLGRRGGGGVPSVGGDVGGRTIQAPGGRTMVLPMGTQITGGEAEVAAPSRWGRVGAYARGTLGRAMIGAPMVLGGQALQPEQVAGGGLGGVGGAARTMGGRALQAAGAAFTFAGPLGLLAAIPGAAFGAGEAYLKAGEEMEALQRIRPKEAVTGQQRILESQMISARRGAAEAGMGLTGQFGAVVEAARKRQDDLTESIQYYDKAIAAFEARAKEAGVDQEKINKEIGRFSVLLKAAKIGLDDAKQAEVESAGARRQAIEADRQMTAILAVGAENTLALAKASGKLVVAEEAAIAITALDKALEKERETLAQIESDITAMRARGKEPLRETMAQREAARKSIAQITGKQMALTTDLVSAEKFLAENERIRLQTMVTRQQTATGILGTAEKIVELGLKESLLQRELAAIAKERASHQKAGRDAMAKQKELQEDMKRAQIDFVGRQREYQRTYGEYYERLDHEQVLLRQRVELTSLSKQPLLAVATIQQQIAEVQRPRIDRLKSELQYLEKGTQQWRKTRERMGAAMVDLARSIDYVRRSWAEMFTAQMFNLPAGSYVMPTAPSGYAQFGAAYTPYGGTSAVRGFGTRQAQLMQLFGQTGRSGLEQELLSTLYNLNTTLERGITVNMGWER